MFDLDVDTGNLRMTKKATKKRKMIGLGSEASISASLVGATSGQGRGGKEAGFWRTVFRKAVTNQYQVSQAQARVAAALGGKYVVRESSTVRRCDGSCATVDVEYPKGGGQRSFYVDQGIDALTLEEVKAAVLEIASSSDDSTREMLRAANMALCSPRVFWALAQLDGGGDVEVAMQALVPNSVDWSFLKSRVRKASEKAMENERQARQEAEAGQKEIDADERVQTGVSTTGPDEAVKMTASSEPVPTGSADSSELAILARRERVAAAAEARLAVSTAGAPSGTSSRLMEGESSSVPIAISTTQKNPKNSLGILETEEARLAAIVGTDRIPELRERLGICNLRLLAAFDVTATLACLGATDNDADAWSIDLHSWVLEARDAEISGLMFEIVGGEHLVLDALRQAKITAPRDLILWCKVPSVTRRAVEKALRCPVKDYDVSDALPLADISHKLSDDNQALWYARAVRVVKEVPWTMEW
eukprot:CAMPEP_0185756416 /NCGR_PEP_ID=MMETSP1174-20130828/14851_1 /TAXON_ID=35687 /ORGANISM="Dictyocha speculum, Strain CCMP1381" /LENGTH=476 /DNA_ID=CAMNT_0028435377 /DNA_START=614 /DNA_END=2041 /DNA_ORIENTATION=+